MSDQYNGNDLSTELFTQKVVIGVISLVVSIVFGLLPAFLSSLLLPRSNRESLKYRGLRTSQEKNAKAISNVKGDITSSTTSTCTESKDCGLGCDNNDCYEAVDNVEADFGHEEGNSDLLDAAGLPMALPKWLSLATSFGGGVFLGASLLHLLPEASSVLDGSFAEEGLFQKEFPRASLACCFGFMAVLALEELMGSHGISMERRSSLGKGHYQGGYPFIQNKQEATRSRLDVNEETLPTYSNQTALNYSTAKSKLSIDCATSTISPIETQVQPETFPVTVMIPSEAHYVSRGVPNHNLNGMKKSSDTVDLMQKQNNRTHHLLETKSSSFALVAALSFHSLFDGLAIGSVTSSSQLKAVSVAILAHKPISAFSLGSFLLSKKVMYQHHRDEESQGEIHSQGPNQSESRRIGKQTSGNNNHNITMNCIWSRITSIFHCVRYACCGSLLNIHQSNHARHHKSHDERENLQRRGSDTPLLHMASKRNITGSTSLEDMMSVKNDPPLNLSRHRSKISVLETMQFFPIDILLYIAFFSTSSLVGTLTGTIGLSLLYKEAELSSTSSWQSSNTTYGYSELSFTGQPSEFDSVSTESSQIPSAGAIVAAIFQSLAAGTFLYAATIEALCADDQHHHSVGASNLKPLFPTKRAGAALFGIIAMAAIKLLEKDDD